MQLDLLPDRPRALRGEEFPSTRFLCDVIKHQMGTMTRQQLRNNWQQGKYPGVNPAWAAWVMQHG